MKRQTYFSGVKWEKEAGYARAVRIGNVIEVSGTTATDQDGEIVGRNHPYRQTQFIFQKINEALQEMGASLEDVVRVRMYVTDVTYWEEIARAHREAFEGIYPAATMVEVKGLIDERLMVEIEATAYLEEI